MLVEKNQLTPDIMVKTKLSYQTKLSTSFDLLLISL